MSYAYFLGGCFLGVIPALTIVFLLGAKRRARIPLFAWWLSLILGVVICFYGMSHSTIPSFSTRITAVGKAYDYVPHISGSRHSNVYDSFRFVPEGGEAVNIETTIVLPGWETNGRMLRLVYLKDSKRVLKNEAVDITILSGKYRGYHDSLDARPFGSWLGIPIGAAVLFFGYTGLRYRKGDAKSTASDDDDNPST
jgi:hypothetical protein